MKTTLGKSSQIACPECDIGPFQRNHYFTGKLLVERDFTDEQRYVMDKLRHHHQRLHGSGVVCGLNITPHESEDCRDRYVCIEPGSAIDCCGREILVVERECIDLTQYASVQALYEAAEAENGDSEPHTLQLCIRYRECPTEEIPVLYDECGCDSTQCAPNRILESWALEVLVDPPAAEPPGEPDENCCDALWDSLDGCPSCEAGDCIVLATIEGYRPGFRFEAMPAEAADPNADAENGIVRLDTRKDRPLLPSTQTLAEIVKCLCEREPDGDGTPGEPGLGIDRVEASFVACDQSGSATIQEIAGDRVLVLEIPRGCDGEDGLNGSNGTDGQDGQDGQDGVGLEKDLTQIVALSWRHGGYNNQFAEVEVQNGRIQRGAVIAFSREVLANRVDAQHIFQILLPNPVSDDRIEMLCRCAVVGTVVPVEVLDKDAQGTIIKAREVPSPAAAVAFIPELKYMKYFLEAREHWVVLRGDFVVDVDGRAVDAEFVRGKLPTGDRPDGSQYGVQGGLFESWFSVHEAPGFGLVDINRGSFDDLKALPRIGEVLAERIVAGRPYRSVDDLLDVQGVTASVLSDIRDLISID